MTQDINPHLLASPVSERPTYPNPCVSWLKMLLFGALAGTVASLLSASWGIAVLTTRTQGVPSRRMMVNLFPYVTLGLASSQWMAAWALTSFSPQADYFRRRTLSYWRSIALRLLTTASFIILSLSLWGLTGEELRVAFNGVRASLIAQSTEAAVAILLWAHLRSIAAGPSLLALGFSRLVWRSVVVMVGRGGTLVLLFVVPILFSIARHSLRLPWAFINFRYCAAVFWDVMAALVLVQFAGTFLSALLRMGR